MVEARGETTISRPIDEVFDYLADARNDPRWLARVMRRQFAANWDYLRRALER
jgi:uncharacterized protein YndB with AHSA1/START domain